jgi:hypothetical protein
MQSSDEEAVATESYVHLHVLWRRLRICARRAIADGLYDSQLTKFGLSAAEDGRQINVRPMHEFNGGACGRMHAASVTQANSFCFTSPLTAYTTLLATHAHALE